MTLSKKPNILFICTDQQHANMMSCAGNSYVNTPAIDSLAAAGVRFTRAYCCNPVCIPSRFSLFTGYMPSAIGMRDNVSCDDSFNDAHQQLALGHCLRQAGYQTAYGGKEHFPNNMRAEDLGFEYLCRDERDDLAATCAAWIKQDHQEPFALVASLINPHDICYMAIKAFASSDFDRKILENGTTEVSTLENALKLPEGMSEDEFWEKHCPPLPENYDPQIDEPESIQFMLDQRGFRRKAQDKWEEKDWRMHRWAYAQLTNLVDKQIGIILDALHESGHADNTIIVFTSDHGDHDGSHRLEHKTIFYNEADNVPMIVVDPRGSAAGTVDDHLISNGLDIFPTLCDYAGAACPPHITGYNLKALAEGKPVDAWREGVYAENEISRMYCSQDYKYVRYDSGANSEQLYDLINDPYQKRNCAFDAGNESILKQHQHALDQEIQRYQNMKL